MLNKRGTTTGDKTVHEIPRAGNRAWDRARQKEIRGTVVENIIHTICVLVKLQDVIWAQIRLWITVVETIVLFYILSFWLVVSTNCLLYSQVFRYHPPLIYGRTVANEPKDSVGIAVLRIEDSKALGGKTGYMLVTYM